MHVELSMRDIRDTFWVFFERVDRKRTVTPFYREFSCSKCERVDELRALRTVGVRPDLKLPHLQRDVLVSNDLCHFVSSASKGFFEVHAKDFVEYFAVPDSPGFWLAVRLQYGDTPLC